MYNLNSTSLLWLALTILFISCSSDKERIAVDPAFGEYISGFTSGSVSGDDPIRVILAQPYSGDLNLSAPLPDNIFSFSPGIDGQAVWLDPQTIHFIPAQKLPGGTAYTAKMELAKLMEVKPGLETFTFQFHTIEQNFSVYTEGYNTYSPTDLTRIQYNGKVHTAIDADVADLQETFTATQNNQEKEIKWFSISGRTFSFSVEDVAREDEAGELLLKWDGSALNSSQKGERKIDIPALGDFRVINTALSQNPEQVLTIYFSDPIAEQSLDGIISIENASGMSFTIDGNEVKAFPDSRVSGQRLL